MTGLTIGQVARQAGVGVEAIRFYERKGLIARPERPASGYRRYPLETVTRIRFLKQAKRLGFTLEEAAELLALRVEKGCACDEVQARAQVKLAAVKARLRELEAMRATLERLIQACKRRKPTSACPILEAIETRSEETGGEPV